MTSPPDGACPLCGGLSRRRLVMRRGVGVVRCTACGLIYVWPQPTPAELAALYSSGGYHAAVDEAERRRTFARRLREIEALVPERGRILDVGCSKGYFLEAARDAGWEAMGVELNANAAAEAAARGLGVRRGDLAEQDFAEASFDAVTLFDLIEHAREPRATLAVCHRLLRPEGLLVVTTPDVGGLVPWVTYWLLGRTIGAWGHPTPPGHLVEFSRRTLRQMLESSGFALLRERSEHIPVAYSAGKLENAVMDVLAGRHRGRRPEAGGARPEAGGARPRASLIRGLPRLCVRALAWTVVGLAGAAARLTGRGDSRWVVAARR